MRTLLQEYQTRGSRVVCGPPVIFVLYDLLIGLRRVQYGLEW